MPRILLVDEEKDVRDFAARFFQERNFDVISAASGVEAIEAVRGGRPDIVLTELKMWDMDGIEMLRRISKARRNTKVIVVSSISDIEIKNEAKKLGVISYLTKPVALGELIEIVLSNIGRQKSFFKLKKVRAHAR